MQKIIVKNLFFYLMITLVSVNNFAQTPKEPAPPYKKTLLIPNFTIANIIDSSKFTNLNFEKGKKNNHHFLWTRMWTLHFFC